MKPFKRFISTVPPWALVFVLLVVVVNSLYLYYRRDSEVLWLLIGMYLITLLFSFGSTYILYKKPGDPAARVFFVYLQLFALNSNAGAVGLPMQNPIAFFLYFAFLNGANLSVAALIHFHLVFPRPSLIYSRHKWLPWIFYSMGLLFIIITTLTSYLATYFPSDYPKSIDYQVFKISMIWIILAVSIALGIAVYQFITIKSTLARNQLRLVIIGSFFGFYTAVFVLIAPELYYYILAGRPYFWNVAQGTGGLVMIAFILIAIFRYRIWDIGIIIRKALLYLSATLIITLSYFLIIFLVNKLAEGESDFTRFLALAISIIIFLVLRDRLQRLIDRFFHRETYDSATVVSVFEEKLAGIYRADELKSKIVQGLDEIFHFKSFVLSLKKNETMYEPAFILGLKLQVIDGEFEISRELKNKLIKSKVFSPRELDQKPSILEVAGGELIVPLLKEDKPYGFFICGPKKSEKTYSMQDIRVLTLIAKRVIALFQTAGLYQKDLDRQLMLERERARISQDMHDDVGASLTRISMMSDLVRNMTDIREDARQWLGQISVTSRDVTEEMDQIIWALNPKNDNLDGLASYIRRFASEYLEPSPVECVFDFPEEMPDVALSVEVRRNIYLVFREALHNVVKHSGATGVDLKLKIEDLRFKISIKDNGHGFELEKLELPGNGLVNMKKRMNDIGGEIVIRSAVGEGTEIELVVVMG